jgi:hypothetical protein
MKPETKFYAQVKRNLTEIQWTRLENISVPGTPDLLGYNNNCYFFTVELKYTKTNKFRMPVSSFQNFMRGKI